MALDLPSKTPAPLKRNIPEGHAFDAKALKPMSLALWSTSVALGHALTSYRQLSRLKSTQVSPDGLLGGQGYVMSVADIRQKLHEACEFLSAISDTLYDEIQAPHWKTPLEAMDTAGRRNVDHLVEESEQVMEDPEEAAGADLALLEDDDDAGAEVAKAVKMARHLLANSSILGIGVIPGGPRVDHLGPGNGDGPEGSENTYEPCTDDNWGMGQAPYASNMPREARVERGPYGPVIRMVPASSSLPFESTPSDSFDFGLGFGAKGQGLDSGDEGASRLPGGPAQQVSDSNPAIEHSVNRKGFSGLPDDQDQPVSRADYSPDYRGNQINVAESALPGSANPVGTSCPSLMGTFEVSEDLATPYVRFEDTTHQLREDPPYVR